MDVQRWEYAGDIEGDPPPGFEGLLPNPAGAWVSWEDYQALERKLSTSAAEHRELLQTLCSIPAIHHMIVLAAVEAAKRGMHDRL